MRPDPHRYRDQRKRGRGRGVSNVKETEANGPSQVTVGDVIKATRDQTEVELTVEGEEPVLPSNAWRYEEEEDEEMNAENSIDNLEARTESFLQTLVDADQVTKDDTQSHFTFQSEKAFFQGLEGPASARATLLGADCPPLSELLAINWEHVAQKLENQKMCQLLLWRRPVSKSDNRVDTIVQGFLQDSDEDYVPDENDLFLEQENDTIDLSQTALAAVSSHALRGRALTSEEMARLGTKLTTPSFEPRFKQQPEKIIVKNKSTDEVDDFLTEMMNKQNMIEKENEAVSQDTALSVSSVIPAVVPVVVKPSNDIKEMEDWLDDVIG